MERKVGSEARVEPSRKTAHPRGRGRLWAGTVFVGLAALACAQTVEAPSVVSEPEPAEQTNGFPYTYCDGNFLTTVNVGSDGRWYTNGLGGRRDVVCEIERRFIPPIIESVDPITAAPGSLVTVRGNNFRQLGDEPHELQIWLAHRDGGVAVLTSAFPRYDLPGYTDPSWDQDQILFQVPNIASQSGILTVVVGGAGHGAGTRWPNEFVVKP